MAQKICTVCDGHGWVPNPNMDVTDPNSPDHIDCTECNGEGWVEDEE